MKQKLLAIALVFCMVLGMIPAVSAAETGTCGDDLRWNFDSATGTLTISGCGEMYDYLASDASKRVPWFYFRNEILELVVEQGVTNLGEYAFQDCKSLHSVKLPDSLTEIKEGVFYGCYSLADIELPDKLVEIGNQVFYGCHALAEIDLPNSITSIGLSAFENTGLTSVHIPTGVTELESNVFTNCESLTEVVFHEGIEIINVGAFAGCLFLSEVELPENLTLLNSSAFAFTGLTHIEIPDKVLEIGGSCFRGCEQLGEIKMGSNIKIIGSYAFEGAPLNQIELPEKLEELGDYAFNFCPLSNIVIPRLVRCMGHRVFNGCQELVEMRFTGNAPCFAEDALASLVADVYYPEGDSSWTKEAMQIAGGTINWIPYEADEPTTPETIASGWSGYTTWTLDDTGLLTVSPSDQTLNGKCNMRNYWKVDGVLTLPWSDCADQITTVVIEEGVYAIGQMAFYDLPNLQTVVLPESLEEIRNYAFKYDTALNVINLEAVAYIREGAFYGCTDLTEVTLGEDTVVESWAFSRVPGYAD